MRGILPEGIRTRWNKRGFRPPQEVWFQNPALLSEVRRVFSSENFKQSEFWNPRWWAGAPRRLEAGNTALNWIIWQPFILQIWRENFLRPVEAAKLAD